MNITTFTIDGPAIRAKLPVPRPSEVPVKPYPWNQFLSDMQRCLNDFAKNECRHMSTESLAQHLTPDGTLYWIRADLDSGTRFLRVYAEFDTPDSAFAIHLSICTPDKVPGRLRLN